MSQRVLCVKKLKRSVHSVQKSVICAENVVLCAKKWAKKVDVCKIGKKCGVCKNVHMSVQIVWWCVQK